MGLPAVTVGVPYHRDLPAPFVQSLVGLLEQAHRVTVDVRVVYAQSPAIHIARENLLRHFLEGGRDYLVMVDTDQVFAPEVVPRLVGWQQPLVAPLIVNRLGDPKPVAFRREGTDLRGLARYSALADECWAYLARFRVQRLVGPSACLPTQPDHESAVQDLPREVREGLDTPLLAVDAVGGGMTCLSRDCAKRVDPGPDDRYFDWEHGGEDLSFCRRVLGAGYAGFHPAWMTSGKAHGVFVDRGCLVGHLAEYARGAVDLGNWLRAWSQATAPEHFLEGGVQDLVEALESRPARGPWETEPLPAPAREPGPYVRERF